MTYMCPMETSIPGRAYERDCLMNIPLYALVDCERTFLTVTDTNRKRISCHLKVRIKVRQIISWDKFRANLRYEGTRSSFCVTIYHYGYLLHER